MAFLRTRARIRLVGRDQGQQRLVVCKSTTPTTGLVSGRRPSDTSGERAVSDLARDGPGDQPRRRSRHCRAQTCERNADESADGFF